MIEPLPKKYVKALQHARYGTIELYKRLIGRVQVNMHHNGKTLQHAGKLETLNRNS